MKQSEICQYIGSSLFVHLPAEVDENSCTEVSQVTREALDRRPIRTLIFDFSGTLFMDSAGIGMLLARYKELSRQSVRLAVMGESDRISRMLRMSGIYTIMQPYTVGGEE